MIIRWICIAIVWVYAVIFYRHKVYGKKHFPKGGALIAPNHSSYLDPPLIGISSPGVVHFIARESLFKNRFFGWLIRSLNTHPVKKGHGNLNTFRKAVELLQSGKKLVIFPEGRRSPDGKLHAGQLGVSMLVYKTNVPVVPVYLHGTFEIWSVRRKFPRPFGKTACVFGSPLYFPVSDFSGEKKEMQEEIVSTIMNRISLLQKWYLDGAKGTPP